ncbi:MAG: hypothetical protein PHS07_00250 [Patescibacteria group bacterium]|jgi:drug/metabolite transporter (DMT)-like permease|nr:hypothetical protein [Patescibacteria group bacterium]
MKKRKILSFILAIFAILFGIFMFIYGGHDDSPGGQLLGVIICVLGLMGLLKNFKRS